MKIFANTLLFLSYSFHVKTITYLQRLHCAAHIWLFNIAPKILLLKC